MPLPTKSRIHRYFFVALRWCAVSGAIFALAFWAGNYLIDHFLKKTYAATAKIELPAVDQSVMRSADKAEVEEILSADVLRPVIYHLELEKTWAKLAPNPNQEVLSDDIALAYLKSVLAVSAVPGSNIITITANSGDPNEAANIANGIADLRAAPNPIGAQPNPIQVLSHATIPSIPAHPNPTIKFAVTVGVAVAAALIASCFVEVVLLLVRASEEQP